MLLHVPKVLTDAQIARCRELMERASWVDGRVTAGHQSAKAKENLQIPEGSPEAREMGDLIVVALERNPLFISAALPQRVFPPLFSCYRPGMAFGAHVDNAVRKVTGTPYRLRTDLSTTLFLSRPEEYDGGELVVEDTYGAHSVKLPAGDLISIRRRACTGWTRSPGAPGWPRSSGSRAGFATTAAGRCSSISTWPSTR